MQWVWAPQVALVVKNLPAKAGDEGDVGSIPGSERFPGGGHGNPLQYSCLENPMDEAAKLAPVHGVTKSRTLLTQCRLHAYMRWAWEELHWACCPWRMYQKRNPVCVRASKHAPSASFRAFISSSTRILIRENPISVPSLRKSVATFHIDRYWRDLYSKNRDSFHLSLRSHNLCVSENLFFFFFAIFQGEDNLAETLIKSTEEKKQFLQSLRRIIANSLLISASLQKKRGGGQFDQDSRCWFCLS